MLHFAPGLPLLGATTLKGTSAGPLTVGGGVTGTVRLEDYGVTTNDTGDNSTAIANALAALPAAGGAVLCPAGTIRYASSIDLGLTKSLVGVGRGVTVMHYTGSAHAVNIGVPGQTGAPQLCANFLEDLSIVGDGLTLAGSIGVRIIKCLNPSVRRIRIKTLETAMRLDASDLWVADGQVAEIDTNEVKFGLLITGNTSKQVNQMTFTMCYFGGSATSPANAYGIKIDNQLHGGNTFVNVHAEGFQGAGSKGFWVAGSGDPGNIFVGCGSEACTQNFLLDSGAVRNTVLAFQEDNVVDNGIANQVIGMSGRRDSQRYSPYSPSFTPDLSEGTIKHIDTMTGAMTVNNPINMQRGQHLYLYFQQDATGGRVITWGTKYRVGANWVPVTTGGKRNSIEFVYDDLYDLWIQVGGATGMAA
ncbi:MAG: hypothetical protein E6I87_08140 [Chloroflexi bacterium]|nr:MAG: hypothetical protein E6I87_08140 [Chloroflexota bacterium]